MALQEISVTETRGDPVLHCWAAARSAVPHCLTVRPSAQVAGQRSCDGLTLERDWRSLEELLLMATRVAPLPACLVGELVERTQDSLPGF